MVDFKLLVSKGLKILLNPPALRNCKIDKTSKVCARSELSRVILGKYSYIGNSCFMVNTQIGKFCSIADKCSIGGARHPIERVSSSPVFHEGKNIMKHNFATLSIKSTPQTIIENDVWLGMGCYVKAGITIHSGAVVGMGSVVTHDIPPYEIWAGNPAKKIKNRFDKKISKDLLQMAWWDWDDKKIQKYAHLFDNPKKLIQEIKEN
ncbi:MAG: antibiotic acetyltransferase [Catenibacterium mitsuokai]|nr:antibiotic acetyltransferase [Catenibacterium mitsuokai]